MHFKMKEPSLFYFVDAEKAFDSVECDFMLQIMLKMAFGPAFLLWMRLIYSNQIAEIFFDGCYSNQIVLNRGLRQGCPLSPVWFNLVIDMLAIAIRQCEVICGIWTPTITHKVCG